MHKFRYTEAQIQALKLLSAPEARHIMLFGGSRSGKTFVLCCAMIRRALKARSRHAIIRRYYNGVRTAIGLDTLPKALHLRYPHPLRYYPFLYRCGLRAYGIRRFRGDRRYNRREILSG